MYNNTRRLALAKKLLCYNNKNIILYIYNSAYVICLICCNHQKSDVMPSSFVFLFFAFCHHASVLCTFSEATAAISAISAFSTRLATALCSRLLQEAGLDPFHISSRPLRISENYKMSDCSGEVWREGAQETFLEKSRKGGLL